MKVSGQTLLSLSLKTVGDDPKSAKIYSIGAVLYDLKTRKELSVYQTLVNNPDEKLSKDLNDNIKKYGKDIHVVVTDLLELFNKGDFVVIHNGKSFTKKLLKTVFSNNNFKLPLKKIWINVHSDINYPKDYKFYKLNHLCAEYGILLDQNSNCHQEARAILDLVLCHKQDLASIIKNSLSTTYIIEAAVNYNDRSLAKDDGFEWESPLLEEDLNKYPDLKEAKAWIKPIKSFELKKLLSNKLKYKIFILRAEETYCLGESFFNKELIKQKFPDMKKFLEDMAHKEKSLNKKQERKSAA